MKTQKTNPAKTLKDFAEERREKMLQSGIRSQSLHVCDTALKRLNMVLGPKFNLPLTRLDAADFVPVRAHLLDSGLAPFTVRRSAVIMRQFLSELVPHGLNPGCVAVFRDRRLAPTPSH